MDITRLIWRFLLRSPIKTTLFKRAHRDYLISTYNTAPELIFWPLTGIILSPKFHSQHTVF
jgi:hypothetical protein